MFNLEQVATECKKLSNEDPFLCQADLTSETDTKHLVESVLNYFKRLDVLVNNAAILEFGSIEKTSLTQYDIIFNTNLRSVYHLTMLVVPHLIATKGSIVNISSVSGHRSYEGVLAYSMSKAALDQFTRCVALELAPKSVRVNGVNPGVILTGIHERSGMDANMYARFVACHPLGRPGSMEEVVKTICFLASEDASFTTGVNFPVDGGRHAFSLQ